MSFRMLHSSQTLVYSQSDLETVSFYHNCFLFDFVELDSVKNCRLWKTEKWEVFVSLSHPLLYV